VLLYEINVGMYSRPRQAIDGNMMPKHVRATIHTRN
jgi:hypothetical protein